MNNINLQELSAFITRASNATYAGGGAYSKTPERLGFSELNFREGKWLYRDSYTGFYRSAGMEVVRYSSQIIWTTCYGGGMEIGEEALAPDTFSFLKQAMLNKPRDWQTFRGPHNYAAGDWKYQYEQNGGIESFDGYEEIYFSGRRVFTHHIIGGLIRDRKENNE